MQLFWLKSFSYKDTVSLVVLCDLGTLLFLGGIVEHVSLWASCGEEIFVPGVKLQHMYLFLVLYNQHICHTPLAAWLLYQSDPVQPAVISVNTIKEMASRGWMEERRKELGYKLLIRHSPEEIHWRGCYASLKIAHACVSKKQDNYSGITAAEWSAALILLVDVSLCFEQELMLYWIIILPYLLGLLKKHYGNIFTFIASSIMPD